MNVALLASEKSTFKNC